MGTDAKENNYAQIIEELAARVAKLEMRETVVRELSELTPDAGLIEAGEIRVHSDYNDPREPGEGFSGVRILGTFEYPVGSGNYFAIVGVNNDVLTFGLSAETGEAVFLSGNAVINQDGITGNELLKWMIRQVATYSTNTRTGKLGMALPEGATVPVWQLSLESPAGAEMMVNGGFEDGDFTGWDKTTEIQGAWEIEESVIHAGSSAVKWTPTAEGDGKTVSLIHFDGADAATTIPDEAGITWTARGNAQLDTAQKVFGTASLLLDGNGDYIDTPDNSIFYVINNNFEYEIRIRIDTLKIAVIFGQANSTLTSPGNYVAISAAGGGTARFTDSAGTAHDLTIPDGTLSINTDYTISFSRFGDTLFLRLDGVTIATKDITGKTAKDSTGKFSIGRFGEYNDFYFKGWIDEFIFKNGSVIHEEDYTPAVSAYGEIYTEGVLTSDRVAVSAGTNYRISSYIKSTGSAGTITIESKWYDDPSAGSLLQTDTIAEILTSTPYSLRDLAIVAPAGADSVEIIITVSETETGLIYFDDISVSELSVSQKLWLSDTGLFLNGVEVGGGAFPTQADLFFDTVLFVPSSGAATTPVITTDTAQRYDWLLDGQQDADNNGNQYYFNVLLAEGTYTLNVLGYTNSASPITKVYIDSALVATFDWYSGSATNNVVKTQASINILSAGIHEIKFVIDGQNGSANGNYRWRVTKAMIWKTS